MNCINKFCIYSDSDKCILEEININSLGICDTQILISLNDDTLKLEKMKLLDRYRGEHEKWDK